MKNNLKSAVAVFFLFFLHGFSIWNGQQGISYNVFGLGEVAFVRWLVCRKAILPNPCYPQFFLISKFEI